MIKTIKLGGYLASTAAVFPHWIATTVLCSKKKTKRVGVSRCSLAQLFEKCDGL